MDIYKYEVFTIIDRMNETSDYRSMLKADVADILSAIDENKRDCVAGSLANLVQCSIEEM